MRLLCRLGYNQAAIRHFEVDWGGFLPATADRSARYIADRAPYWCGNPICTASECAHPRLMFASQKHLFNPAISFGRMNF
jgi:hypothetical protein